MWKFPFYSTADPDARSGTIHDPMVKVSEFLQSNERVQRLEMAAPTEESIRW